jgi:hypothetical protein
VCRANRWFEEGRTLIPCAVIDVVLEEWADCEELPELFGSGRRCHPSREWLFGYAAVCQV